MDVIEFGKRVQRVREEILNMTQAELAPKMNTTQTLLSRLERGIGGNIFLVFDFVNFLMKKKLFGHMLFREPFDIELLSRQIHETPQEKVLELVTNLKQTANEDYENLVLLHNILSRKKL